MLDEIHAFLWQYNLCLASIARYERQALIGSDYGSGLRVTFDTNLTAQARPLRLEEPPSSLPMLPANMTVMEIKVNERIPYWLTELVAAHNLQLARISKYCQSVETFREKVRVTTQPVLAKTAICGERSQMLL